MLGNLTAFCEKRVDRPTQLLTPEATLYNNRMRCRIKICGVTTVEAALAAVRAGTDAIGLNVYPKSPRAVSEAAAIDILAALPPFVEPVMLSVDESWETALARLRRLPGIRTVQRHDAQPCPAADVRWIPAFGVRDAGSLAAIRALLERCRPVAILVDASVPGQFGGTGQTLPWDLLDGFDPGVPLILAGGLTPENVAEAVKRLRPFAVDVASGVESRPGVKDADRMRRFVDAVRTAEIS
jgi:phosphoribosylanthranilate isomerase